jgi:hypothetical protein
VIPKQEAKSSEQTILTVTHGAGSCDMIVSLLSVSSSVKVTVKKISYVARGAKSQRGYGGAVLK